ncbi:acetyltransferase [Advenella faeciporci]|uniref:Acetyltransferase n=1 Tax=Advenella faeciporci TaxID=797535 RepID=A0A918JNT8_9BURK|nr:GNAT family acetyltransferase [Advenella faeciporci]NLY35114.1 GNAT family acetyltransferase [Alcaligenaceae bacterium]GGW89848.1 acetyltransferase [Advenella faeciporci]
MKIRSFLQQDEDAVIRLWNECGLVRPWNDPKKDIERKLTTQPELFLVVEKEGVVVGSAMVGYEGHRGWVYYLAVDPACQGQGIGQALMQEAEHLLMERGCPKIQLLVRSNNSQVLDFYERLGYETGDVVMLGKRLIPDA